MMEDSQSIVLTEQIQPQVQYMPPEPAPLITTPNAYPAVAASSMQQKPTPASQLPATKGLAQTFGLHASAATLTVLVDMMVFGSDVISAGVLVPLEIVAGGMVGLIVYKIQKHWYGDDHQSALIKAMIVGLLTAIPAPFSPVVAVPAGLVGLAKTLRRRK